MKRALPLLVAGTLGLASANVLAAGPSIIGSLYAADVEVSDPTGSAEASPDGLSLEIRQPLNDMFWIGAALTTSLTGDSVAPGIDLELGDSITFNLGLQHEFAHNMAVYGYIGYGTGEVTLEDSITPASDSADGKSVAWGLGLNFGIGDHLLVDAGYASLFDGDMEDATGASASVTIAGPRVGMGFRF